MQRTVAGFVCRKSIGGQWAVSVDGRVKAIVRHQYPSWPRWYVIRWPSQGREGFLGKGNTMREALADARDKLLETIRR